MSKIARIAVVTAVAAIAASGVLLSQPVTKASTSYSQVGVSPAAIAEAKHDAAVLRTHEALGSKLAEIEAEVLGVSETGAEIDAAAESLAATLAEAEQLIAVKEAPTFPGLIVHSASNTARVIAPANEAVELLDADFAAWQGAVSVARVEREAREAQAAAEAAAAELAAQQTQPQAYASAQQHAGGESYAPAPQQNFTVYPAGTGGQGLIDACAGPVWQSYMSAYLAEHWHCGGASFPRGAGAVVDVAGVGTFQSVGIVTQLNGYTSSFGDVPPGYDLYYQTCLNNDPTTTVIIGLYRI